MRISSVEEYNRIEALDPAAQEDEITDRQFPHVVVVECDFPEWDLAIRWCWRKFGPRHGECWGKVDYTACPLVLMTEHVVKTVVQGKTYEVKRYSSVDVHHHVGTWTTRWFTKTDYDHGYGAFCFSNEADKAQFVQYVPLVDWGENFPWLENPNQ
jgi:hypothetical protein